jgi:hypothetical protein
MPPNEFGNDGVLLGDTEREVDAPAAHASVAHEVEEPGTAQ